MLSVKRVRQKVNWFDDTVIGCFITSQVTPSVQGAAVREPSYL
jgi:hypothetical protein